MSTTTITATSQQQEDQRYIELARPLEHAPPVIVFFSFLDQTSRTWATKDRVVSTIRKHVPNGTNIVRYHSSEGQSAEFAKELTHAWAVAHELQIDDRVIEPLFEAIQGPTKAVDMQGVKLAFDQVGIPPLRFDREYGKVSVLEEAKWMEEAAQHLGIQQVPAIVVAGKYLLNTDDTQSGIKLDEVANVVKELLALNK